MWATASCEIEIRPRGDDSEEAASTSGLAHGTPLRVAARGGVPWSNPDVEAASTSGLDHGTPPRAATRSGVPWANPDVEAASSLSSPLGRISISHEAVAHIVGRVAAEAYGVVGLAPRT